MDFFEHQEVARKKTGQLVVFFGLAVLGIILLVYLAVAVFVGAMASQGGGFEPSMLADWRLIAGVGLGVITVVALGSMYKVSQLSAGGHVVAEMLGGRLIEPGSRQTHERKVLNVVEEMAIASGTAVPPVYVMENETAINAFAAGFAPTDAVIGVTRGCIEKLSRDELQGVIAHEFSHVFNGDMRLNIRLIGVIHGILVIGLIGYGVVRSLRYSALASSSRRRNNKDSGGAIMAIFMLGIALMVIGFVGTFFGNMIKAAVSRQREFLADASAVQFTRNPDGIAGALKKIGGLDKGAELESGKAGEVSHMLFGQGVSGFMGQIFATHPPLVERIRRIDAQFDGQMTQIEEGYAAPLEAAGLAGAASGLAGGAVAAAAPSPPPPLPPAEAAEGPAVGSALEQFGRPTPQHIAYAQELIQSIPQVMRDTAHEAYGARALVFALLLDEDAEVRQVQIDRLAEHADPAVLQTAQKLLSEAQSLDAKLRLPLIDMTLPALTEMSPGQYATFKDNVSALIRADGRVSLFEWVMHRVLTHHLEPHFARRRGPDAKYRSLTAVQDHAVALLGTLAYAGHKREGNAKAAFDRGAAKLGLGALELPASDRCGLGALNKALDELNLLTATPKRLLLQASATVIAADQRVTVREAELFRAIADSLDCPVPPLLPGQPLV